MSVSLYVDASVLNSTDEVIVEGRRTVNLRAGTNVAMTKSGYDDVVISSSSPTVTPASFWVRGSAGAINIPNAPALRLPLTTSLSATGTGLTWNTGTYQTNEDVGGMGLDINIAAYVLTPSTGFITLRLRTTNVVLGSNTLAGRSVDPFLSSSTVSISWSGIVPVGAGPLYVDLFSTVADGQVSLGSSASYLQMKRFY